ncbi:MAG: T9SS type A sorting domain-containing protein, partial [Flavobacteriia bacterium]
FSGTNKRSLNATGAAPTFTTLSTIPGGVACYDGIIDRDDSDILVVGTSEGVFVTEDGGGTWENASVGFEGTPVYEVRQSWRSWNDGNYRPGEIYIGTYGRGIWSSAAYLGIGDADGNGVQEFKTKLKTYPNPTTENTTLTFNLQETSNVTVMVYNITGTLVKTITDKNVAAGAQTLTIDGSELPRGTYIVKFVAGKQSDTVKFIKM